MAVKRDAGFERILHDKAPIGFFGLIFNEGALGVGVKKIDVES